MPGLVLPPKVAREIQKEQWVAQRQRWRAKVEAMFDFDDPVCKQWNPELKQLDPLLRMGRARPLAYEKGWTVIPGFYHWVRDNETTAPTVTPITGPDDTFREPDSGVLEDLKRNDLQNPAVFMALLAQRSEQEKAKEARIQERRERMNQEVVDAYLAGNRAFVSMDRSAPWTQSARGKRSK